MSSPNLRFSVNLAKPAPSPLWVSTELAREHYRKTCIAYGNQEATMTELVEAAERLRSLQLQWKKS